MPGRTEKKKRQGTYTPAFKGGKRGQNAQNAGRKTLRHATRGENWSPRLSTYDLSSPSPTSYVYLHVYPRTDLGYVYSPPSLGAVVVSTPTSDKPLILFIKREINIASRCPPRRRRRCTQREAKGEGEREEEEEGRRSENAGDGRSKPIVYLRLRLCDPTPTHVSPSSYLTWRNVGWN